MKRHVVLRTGLLVLFMALPHLSSRAVSPPSFTWTGTSLYSDELFNRYNWAGDVAPPNDGTAEFVFGNARRTYAYFYDELRAERLSFIGHARPYYLEKYGTPTTTYIGSGGIFYNPLYATVRSTIDDAVVLNAAQTWDIQKGALVITGPVSGNATLTKTGSGNLVLESTGSTAWTGGLVLSQGGVAIQANMGDGALISHGLGTGPLTFNGGALIAEGSNYYYDDSKVLLANSIISNGLIFTKNQAPLYLIASGGVRLDANTTIRTQGEPLYIESQITELGGARQLAVGSPDFSAIVVMSGANSYTGGTHVQQGLLIFGTQTSIPGAGQISAASTGYVGLGAPTYGTAEFLGKFHPGSTQGTIGFDSDPQGLTNSFTGNINLTGFGTTTRLGSATKAILSGLITPQGSETDPYRFGSGGGILQVDSSLTGTRSLVLDSPPALPLTVRLTSTGNNYTGGTSVTNSALIFGGSLSTGTFPGGTRNITINAGGYVGFEFWDDLSDTNFVLQSLAKIITTSVGAVGFDNYSLITVPIDLSSFTNALYLGTATGFGEGPGLTLSGAITPAGGASAPYRFAGYKGGALEVASALTGANGVHIGDPNSLGTFGDPAREEISTVVLSGNNSYGGTTTLYTGHLMVGQRSGVVGTDPTTALSTGALVVQPHNLSLPDQLDEDDLFPELSVVHDNTVIPNAIQLNSGLYVAEDNEFSLAGAITGSGKLIVGENTYLTLSGNNTFSGGIYLQTWAGLTLASNTATGTGPLGFGGGNSTNVYVETNAPVIHGLYSRDDNDYTFIHLAENETVLTIMQPTGVSRFMGNIHSDYTNGTARFVKDGPGTLRLYGDLNFYGINDEARDSAISAEIRAGTLLVSSKNYDYGEFGDSWYGYSRDLGYDKVLLSGGTLVLDYQTTLDNSLITEAGRLAGYGTFYSHVTIGNGVTVSPGLAEENPVGRLQFDELTLAPAGTYEWNIMAVSSGEEFSMVWDRIDIGSLDTLFITATEESPFSIRIISLSANGQPGVIDGFVAGDLYSAMIISSSSIQPSGAFNAAKFALDVSQFQTNLGTGSQAGSFSLTLDGSNLVLNFAAVPEPSTYALMLLGLGFVGWTVWRRRRG